MNVQQVIEVAKEWVEVNASRITGFCGAHLMGGITAMSSQDHFSTYRDVDIAVVLKDKGMYDKDEIAYKGILLEIGFYDLGAYESPEEILTSAELASHLAAESILSDPTGILTRTHEAVAKGYAQRNWVLARYQRRKQGVPFVFAKWNQASSVAEMLPLLLYSVETLTSLIAIVNLKSPTLRRCLVLLKNLLKNYPGANLHEEALNVLGFARLSREQVQSYLNQCAKAFDLAVRVKRTPSPFDFKLHAHLRPYFVEASQEMIDEGNYREAMWWVLSCIYISVAAIENDAPEADRREHQHNLVLLLNELGLKTDGDWRDRLQAAQHLAEKIYQAAEQIIELNPEITD